jgi:hypothetical protein
MRDVERGSKSDSGQAQKKVTADWHKKSMHRDETNSRPLSKVCPTSNDIRQQAFGDKSHKKRSDGGSH